MNCKQIREEIVFRLVDNELGQGLLLEYSRHVSDCPHCARKARFTRGVLMIVRRETVRLSAPKSLRLRIRDSFPHRQDPADPRPVVGGM